MNTTVKRLIRKIARRGVACLICLCMIAGAMAFAAPSFAAATTSKSPFNGKTYAHNSRFNGNLIVHGVDVSYWQSKNCDWNAAKKAGVDYAILRVTYTNYGPSSLKLNIDSHFETNFKKARAAGVMRGVYVFSQAKNATEGKKEAEYAVARLKKLGIGPKDLELPVYMDYEFSGGRAGRLYGISKTNATNAAVAFCNTIKSYGYQPGIYANLLFLRNTMDPSKLGSDVDIWCAQYNNSCGLASRYGKWQYSSDAKINGIYSTLTGFRGKTDVNFWYLNRKVNAKPITVIKGRTTLSLADAKNPKFTITNGKTTLKQGTDYIVGGIRNNRYGSAYAYIKGIGRYGGYALVPLTVANRTSGSASTNLNKKCANYLTYKSNAKSSYVGTSTAKFKKGGEYTTVDYLNIRSGAGTGYAKTKYSALSANAKKACINEGGIAVLKKGTKVKVLEVKSNWIRVQVKVNGKWETLKGGWICTGASGETYVK